MREMKKRIVLTIEENEMNALEALAKMELRTAWQQAALIIRNELEKQGLIETAKTALTVTAEILQTSTKKEINAVATDDKQE